MCMYVLWNDSLTWHIIVVPSEESVGKNGGLLLSVIVSSLVHLLVL